MAKKAGVYIKAYVKGGRGGYYSLVKKAGVDIKAWVKGGRGGY